MDQCQWLNRHGFPAWPADGPALAGIHPVAAEAAGSSKPFPGRDLRPVAVQVTSEVSIHGPEGPQPRGRSFSRALLFIHISILC